MINIDPNRFIFTVVTSTLEQICYTVLDKYIAITVVDLTKILQQHGCHYLLKIKGGITQFMFCILF